MTLQKTWSIPAHRYIWHGFHDRYGYVVSWDGINFYQAITRRKVEI